MPKRILLTLPDSMFDEIEKQSKNTLSKQETIRKMIEKGIEV